MPFSFFSHFPKNVFGKSTSVVGNDYCYCSQSLLLLFCPTHSEQTALGIPTDDGRWHSIFPSRYRAVNFIACRQIPTKIYIWNSKIQTATNHLANFRRTPVRCALRLEKGEFLVGKFGQGGGRRERTTLFLASAVAVRKGRRFGKFLRPLLVTQSLTPIPRKISFVLSSHKRRRRGIFEVVIFGVCGRAEGGKKKYGCGPEASEKVRQEFFYHNSAGCRKKKPSSKIPVSRTSNVHLWMFGFMKPSPVFPRLSVLFAHMCLLCRYIQLTHKKTRDNIKKAPYPPIPISEPSTKMYKKTSAAPQSGMSDMWPFLFLEKELKMSTL